MGARFLRQQLLRPSANIATIKARQHATQYLAHNDDILGEVAKLLQKVTNLDVTLNQLLRSREGKHDSRVTGSNIKTIISLQHTLLILTDIAEHLHINHNSESSQPESSSLASDKSQEYYEATPCNRDEFVRCPELIEAISRTLVPPCTQKIQEKISNLLTESTHFTRSTLGSQHQEVFALRAGQDGMLDVSRKTYLQTAEEIYSEAESLSEEYNLELQVNYTAGRGYHLKLPAMANSLPEEFIQCVQSPRFIACTTKKVASLSDRSQEAISEALSITDQIVMNMIDWLQNHLTELIAQAEAVAMLDMLMSFAVLSIASPREWCCPVVREDGPLAIKAGRHPILAELSADHSKIMVDENSSRSEKNSNLDECNSGFVPNDTFMDEFTHMHLVSGVNGSGKTTVRFTSLPTNTRAD